VAELVGRDSSVERHSAVGGMRRWRRQCAVDASERYIGRVAPESVRSSGPKPRESIQAQVVATSRCCAADGDGTWQEPLGALPGQQLACTHTHTRCDEPGRRSPATTEPEPEGGGPSPRTPVPLSPPVSRFSRFPRHFQTGERGGVANGDGVCPRAPRAQCQWAVRRGPANWGLRLGICCCCLLG